MPDFDIARGSCLWSVSLQETDFQSYVLNASLSVADLLALSTTSVVGVYDRDTTAANVSLATSITVPDVIGVIVIDVAGYETLAWAGVVRPYTAPPSVRTS